jgi:hypothetical protein
MKRFGMCLSIFFCGGDQFVHLMYQRNAEVTALELKVCWFSSGCCGFGLPTGECVDCLSTYSALFFEVYNLV